MIRVRNLACTYIFNSNKILMMKRSPNKSFLPNLWAPVGGNLKPSEINDPRSACLREIEEETGIKITEIHDLALKYITIRRKDDEIRIQYIYFCTTTVTDIKECDEGKLHWIDKADILDLNMSLTNTNALEHYFKIGKTRGDVFVGVVDVTSGYPVIEWKILESFNTFN